MNCPVCRHAVAGRQCANCGASVSADGMWAYRWPAEQPAMPHAAPPTAGQHGPQGAAVGTPQPPVFQQPYPQPAPGQSPAYPGPQAYGAVAPFPEPAVPAAPKRRRGRFIGILAAVAVVLVIAVAGGILIFHHGSGSKTVAKPTSVVPIRRDFGPMVAVSGSLIPVIKHVHDVGPLAGSTPIQAEVALNVRDAQGLEKLVKELYNPKSSRFRQFMTPAQFAAQFAPTAADRANVAGWLAAKGLKVTAQTSNGLLIEARGTAAQMNRVFGTRIDQYSDGSGFTFFANSTDVHVPRDLATTVLDVDGLSNIGHPSTSARPRARVADSPTGYTPDDLRRAYNLSSLYTAGLDASNQTIALAEWDDFQQQDIDTYDQKFGLSTPKPERISVPFDGQAARPGSGQDEVELDIEVLHAIAPKAHVLVYVSPQTNGSEMAQANRIMSEDRASVVSVSWGFPDAIVEVGALAAVDQVLAEGAAQGQAVLVASGDAGAFDDANAPTTPIVDYPSSDPFVTAVGGTSLTVTSAGYGGETAWSDRHNKSGSGGGLSLYFRRPWYQSGPGVINQFSGRGARQTPDVAAVADPRTGYSVFVTSKGQTGWAEFGGTSASTPLWAGYMALVQQKLGHQLGFLNPLLYRMARRSHRLPAPPYHDVTTGDNLLYPATPGWDFATGWGSMDGANMLQDIQQLEPK